jgi:capsular polysaccharide biosynthesis protein
MATAPQPVQLTDLVGSLRRHWPVVVIAAVIGLVLGVLASLLIPSSYQATTTVAVEPMNADPLTASVEASQSVSMATESGIATSRKVAEAASKALRPDHRISADEIVDSTTVSSPEDSLILRVGFTGDSAKEAKAGADAVAEAYLTTRRADASAQIDRLVKAAQDQIAAVQATAADPANQAPIVQRSLQIQADALGTKLAELANFDLTPGQVVGAAQTPSSPSTPGALPLGLAGLFLGLLVGVPIALLRKEEDSEIGGVEGLQSIGDQIVLDGTKDTNRADTWDIAAFMLKIPTEIGVDGPFTIMVDAEEEPGRGITPGQELADALLRRGRTARFVDAGMINEGKISRGWPTEKKRISWGGEIIIIDTTHLTSDANKVALATRSDSVLLARSTADDSAALRRLVGLLKSKSVDIALTALFPPRSEAMANHHR